MQSFITEKNENRKPLSPLMVVSIVRYGTSNRDHFCVCFICFHFFIANGMLRETATTREKQEKNKQKKLETNMSKLDEQVKRTTTAVNLIANGPCAHLSLLFPVAWCEFVLPN